MMDTAQIHDNPVLQLLQQTLKHLDSFPHKNASLILFHFIIISTRSKINLMIVRFMMLFQFTLVCHFAHIYSIADHIFQIFVFRRSKKIFYHQTITFSTFVQFLNSIILIFIALYMTQLQIRAKLRQNNHYYIVEVRRYCTETQLKQSYKKLALKFHPDKNQAQGAKEVFSKITNSYHILLKERKRQNFCQSMDEGKGFFKNFEKENLKKEDENMKKGKTNFNEKQYKKATQEYQEMMRDIKKTFQKWQEREKQKKFEKEENEKRKKQYQQYIRKEEQRKKKEEQSKRSKIVFGIILFIMMIAFLKPSMVREGQKIYSLKMSDKHKFQLKTKILQNNYFVSDQYFNKKLNREQELKIEMIVDRVYLNDLKKDCKMAQNNIEKISKSAYKMKIGKKRSDLLKKAKNIDTKSCDILVNYGLEFGEYIKVLQNKK